MTIQHTACAGTLESSDIFVTVRPAGEGAKILLTSSVEAQFGDAIRAVIREVAEGMGATGLLIEAVDHGALDCTIRARVETAILRAAREEVARG